MECLEQHYTALQQRVTESTEAHNKLQSHLSKEMQEIYDQARFIHLSTYKLTRFAILYQGPRLEF